MKTIALCQAFNEEIFIERYLEWLYPCVDGIVITEGGLSPFNNLPVHSTDNTFQLIRNFIQDHDPELKVILLDRDEERIQKGKTREAQEGINKNGMLNAAITKLGLGNGDLIFIGDIDEFWDYDPFMRIVQMFRDNDQLLHVPVEEWQFAYGLEWAFKASHDGRFMRYLPYSRFGDTNHFFVDGRDVTKDYRYLQKREDTNMWHLCWSKRPEQIREKCISYSRPSLETWFNFVYLQWPFKAEAAYHNNALIPPYHGTGYAEGQHELLNKYDLKRPQVLQTMQLDWIEFVKTYAKALKIDI